MEQQTDTPYRKLSSAVWLGPDHLLYLRRELFAERAKRFAFPDIQAVIIRQTPTYRRLHILLLAAAGFFWLMIIGGLSLGMPGWLLAFLLVPSLVILTGSLVHWRLGPTCSFHIRTAVQIEELRSLQRLRKARHAFDALSLEIARAQGARGTEAVSEADWAAWRAWDTGTDNLSAGKPVLERREPRRRDYNGWAHGLLFLSLLFSALVSALVLVRFNRMVFGLGIANLAMTVGSLVASMVMQHTRDVTRELRVMGWVCTGYIVASNLVPGTIVPNELVQDLLFRGGVDVWQYEGFLIHVMISMVLELLLAVSGFYFLSRFRHRARREWEATAPAAVESAPGTERAEGTAGEEHL